jgi:adenylate cyclase
MAVQLKRLLVQNQRRVTKLLDETIAAMGSAICIQDLTGSIFLGDIPKDGMEKHGIECADETLGWVVGKRGSQELAHWLSYLSNQAIELDRLADETLDCYREVNLLYNLSGKLTASLDPKVVCNVVVEEARRLIQSSAGGVMLLDEPTRRLMLITGFGPIPAEVNWGDGVIGICAQSNKAEIVNSVMADQRHSQIEAAFGAMLCTPLENVDHTLGVIVLASEPIDVYAAGDLKLLNTLASQSAPIIANVLMHERMLQEAKEREERLEQQIQALRIELDDSRQARKVAEITETDYFKNLRSEADSLRKIITETTSKQE